MLRLNVRDAAGRDVMRAYGVYLVPTFLVFDGAGNLLFRQGGTFPDVATIKEWVRGGERSTVVPENDPQVGSRPSVD